MSGLDVTQRTVRDHAPAGNAAWSEAGPGAAGARGRARLAPDLAGGLDDEAELGGLLVLTQHVSFHRGGEAALRGQAELVERDVPGGLVDPALEGVLALQGAALGGDQAEDDHLAGRDEPQRLEPAGALVVVLQEEPVHGQLAEQGLGDEVVTALRRPRGAEVAAAHVRGDGHAVGAAGDGGVDLPDVTQVQVLGVLAAAGDLGALGRVVEVGEAGVVELQVTAAEGAEPGDLVGVRGGQVGPELLDVRVHSRVQGGRAAPVMDHVRSRRRTVSARTATRAGSSCWWSALRWLALLTKLASWRRRGVRRRPRRAPARTARRRAGPRSARRRHRAAAGPGRRRTAQPPPASGARRAWRRPGTRSARRGPRPRPPRRSSRARWPG